MNDLRRSRGRRVTTRAIVLAVLLLVAVGALLVAAPYVASTRLVRERIALEMGAWSGYRVTIGAPPRIEIWPRLRAVLPEVSFTEKDGAGTVVAEVERVEIELSALAAMRGDAVFTSTRLIRPTVTLGTDKIGLTALVGRGRVWDAVERTRSALERLSPEEARAELPDDPFGTVIFESGTVVLAGNAATPLVEALSGRIEWPALNAAVTVQAGGRWRGESARLEIHSADPLLLMAGAAASLSLKADAAPVQASFEGTARLAEEHFLEGRTAVSVPSVEAFAVWVGAKIVGLDTVRSLTLASNVSGDLRRLKLDGARLQLNGATATGAIELTASEGRPSVSGSLAFDKLALDEAVDTLVALAAKPAVAGVAPSPFAADIRLSTAQASFGGLQLIDTAATVQVQKDFAAVDVLDSTLFGGVLQATARFDLSSQESPAKLQVSLKDVDGAALAAALGVPFAAPSGRAGMTLEITGAATSLHQLVESGEGTVSVRFGAGTLANFDLTAFLERSRKGGFFPLSETAGSGTATEGVEVRGTLARGVARIEKAQARLGQRRLWLSGLVSYKDNGLALTGGVGPAEDADGSAPAPDETGFFVGGSWSAPFISPIRPDAGRQASPR